MTEHKKDFFISYNQADEGWATWIAWQLEQAGYTTVIQAWDFRPGNNFVLEMQQAAQAANKTIAVLSPAFLDSDFTAPEWAAAFAGDPAGKRAALIPVVIAPCDIDGLLGQIIHIDLVDVEEREASKRLLAGLEVGRAKPLSPPAFPGKSGFPGPAASPARPTPQRWQPLSDELNVTWRVAAQRDSDYGPSILEIHLVPVEPIRLEVRRLAELADELAVIGRGSGLFSQAESVATSSSSDLAIASTGKNPGPTNGLMVTRRGQRGGWITLPHDHMGSVFDAADLRPRITTLLELYSSIDVAAPESVGIAAAIRSTSMLIDGDASVVGRRSQASFPHISRGDITIDPDDSITFAAVVGSSTDVAEEIVARLGAALKY